MTVATSRITIEQDVVELLGRMDASSQLLPVPIAATTTASDALSIRSTTLDRGNPSTGAYDGMLVKIATKVGSGPEIGEISRVVSGGYDGTDKITVSPAFTAAVESTAQFMLYPARWTPEIIVAALRRILRNSRIPAIWAPSLVADPDLSLSDTLGDNWSDVGSPTTTEYDTAAANVLMGERSIKVVDNSAADEGVASASFPVHDVKSLLVTAPVKVAAGSAKVVLRRMTATAADIKSVTLDEVAFTEARITESLPDGTKEAAVRFLSAESGSTFYVSPHIIVQALQTHAYALPSWLVNPAHILAALFLPVGQGAEDTDNYVPLSHPMMVESRFKILRSDRDVNPLRVQFTGRSYPLYLKVLRQAADLATDAATTIVDRNFLVKKTAANLLRDRGDDEWRRLAGEAAQAAREAGYGVPPLSVEEKLISA